MLHIAAAVLALTDPSGPIVDARIADIIADPERYGGQTLSIRGQIDACYGFTCSICPEEMTPATANDEQCLRISFDSYMSEEDTKGPRDALWTPSARSLVEETFRFSVVTAEGVFNPECLTGRPWPPEAPASNADEVVEIVCVDRAVTWGGVVVRAVHRRIPSNDGLVFDVDFGVLTSAPAEIAVQVETAYRDYLVSLDDGPEDRPLAVFVPQSPDFRPAGEEARLCICLKEECGGDWPVRDISLRARTPNDPYVCYSALRIAGVWRVYPD
ncbi:hypothetical protein GGQ87_001848 [Brevundimonas alba]|uniref:Uncharacterized protein n=1 Tax=Brevundimonas alba TaxID=74314 RepID=A0A7X5YN56_9CAUL|nr:hypothetical protein [Brevundimonas alba]NJC41590.1 hypothetical protein [Brevundimonas alba]